MIAVRASNTSLTLVFFSSVPRAICFTTSPFERRLVAGVALKIFFFTAVLDMWKSFPGFNVIRRPPNDEVANARQRRRNKAHITGQTP